jgi:hypothetical protein
MGTGRGERQQPFASGRYAIYDQGRECGEEDWLIEVAPDGLVATGAQTLEPPHPFPCRQRWRAGLTDQFRLTGYEVEWEVGPRTLRAAHRAEGHTWHVGIDFGGERREQQGDYPDYCEVELTTPLSLAFMLARRDFQVGGEHEFPVLRIGPPLMAVSPEQMLIRCVGRGDYPAPWGQVAARRYILSLPPQPEAEGYGFWATEEGFVLESFAGPEPGTPWMRLTDFRRGV